MFRSGPRAGTFTRFSTLFAVWIGIFGVALCGWGGSALAAGVGGCRADPIVKLSDGTVLDVTADIATDVANVTSISYVVHGPRASALLRVISTPTIGFTGKESFTYVADAPANTYITETVVQTSVSNVAVTAHTTFANVVPSTSANAPVQYTYASGRNGQVLRVTVRR